MRCCCTVPVGHAIEAAWATFSVSRELCCVLPYVRSSHTDMHCTDTTANHTATVAQPDGIINLTRTIPRNSIRLSNIHSMVCVKCVDPVPLDVSSGRTATGRRRPKKRTASTIDRH